MLRFFTISFFLLLINTHFLSAQKEEKVILDRKTERYFSRAKDHFNNKNYDRAIKNFERVIRSQPDFVEAYLYLAGINYERKDYDKTELYYKTALEKNPDYDAKIYYSLALVQELNGKIEEALYNYRYFIDIYDNSDALYPRTKEKIKILDFRLAAFHDPVPFNPERLSENINSEWSEYLPTLTGDNEIMIFTRRENNQEDFYVSYKVEGEWSEAQPLSDLNTPGNEGAHTITVDGKTMIYTMCRAGRRQGGCDLYVTYNVKGKWTRPRNLGPPVNSEFWESQPSISHDGRTLYFVSNRPGCIGGKDIWYSELADGRWSHPVCMDTTINTPYDDFAPFIHADNRTLYFSSSGHPGMGGSDLFMSVRSNGKWSQAKNLGYPVNTENDEGGIFITLDGKTAYFSSDRDSGPIKNLDIYSFEIPEQIQPSPVTYVKGMVLDNETKMPVNARIEISDNNTGEMLRNLYTNAESFLIALEMERDYNFSIFSENHIFHSRRIALNQQYSSSDPQLVEIYLVRIPALPADTIETPFVLNNIFFELNSAEINKRSSAVELNNLLSFLKENEAIKIRINGHTDSSGTPEYNLSLSEMRARAVYDYLVNNGIDPSRLSYKGYGESRPLASNETEEGRSRNRRTEFQIIR